MPLAALRAAKCQPLIERFAVRDVPEAPGSDPSDNGVGVVELYIPAPAMASKEQALLYHLATRNLFAWVFRKSLVGHHLGQSIVGLLDSMHEFRSPDAENLEELLDYLNGEGYLDMLCRPGHALAILHFAEFFQLKGLYINAFAHCVGMSDRLFLSSEYEHIRSASRKLVRRGRVEMGLRLGRAGAMLGTFLEDDLSEANLGLSAGARAHLDRFRSFLFSFYTSKFGCYPPRSIDARSTIFEPKKYRIMRADFEALYDYLVDESFTTSQSSPFLAQGGICTLQSVHSFDLRHQFRSLDNPLPLLPKVVVQPTPKSKKFAWLPKPDKLRPDGRLIAHAALAKAANTTRVDLLDNDLVCAYRRFEEDSVFDSPKADRMEKVTQVDARKVRWILIYAAYQTLLSCTEAPPGVAIDDAPYNLAISAENLPPWREELPIRTLLRRQASLIMDLQPPSMSSSGLTTPSNSATELSIEIKPDVDYFALTHRDEQTPRQQMRFMTNGPPAIPPRTMSLTRSMSLSRNNTIRRSLSLFRGGPAAKHHDDDIPPIPLRRPSRPTHHEIVVQGYGNGTNRVNLASDAGDVAAAAHDGTDAAVPEEEEQKSLSVVTATANRSPSTSSSSSRDSGSHISSTSVSPDSPTTTYTSLPGSRRGSAADPCGGVPTDGSRALRRLSLAASTARSTNDVRNEAANDMPPVPSLPPTVPRRNPGRRYFSMYGLESLRPTPLRVPPKRQSTIGIPGTSSPWDGDDRTHYMETAYQRALESVTADREAKSEWEHFVGIGGLVAASAAAPAKP